METNMKFEDQTRIYWMGKCKLFKKRNWPSKNRFVCFGSLTQKLLLTQTISTSQKHCRGCCLPVLKMWY